MNTNVYGMRYKYMKSGIFTVIVISVLPEGTCSGARI